MLRKLLLNKQKQNKQNNNKKLRIIWRHYIEGKFKIERALWQVWSKRKMHFKIETIHVYLLTCVHVSVYMLLLCSCNCLPVCVSVRFWALKKRHEFCDAASSLPTCSTKEGKFQTRLFTYRDTNA